MAFSNGPNGSPIRLSVPDWDSILSSDETPENPRGNFWRYTPTQQTTVVKVEQVVFGEPFLIQKKMLHFTGHDIITISKRSIQATSSCQGAQMSTSLGKRGWNFIAWGFSPKQKPWRKPHHLLTRNAEPTSLQDPPRRLYCTKMIDAAGGKHLTKSAFHKPCIKHARGTTKYMIKMKSMPRNTIAPSSNPQFKITFSSTWHPFNIVDMLRFAICHSIWMPLAISCNHISLSYNLFQLKTKVESLKSCTPLLKSTFLPASRSTRYHTTPPQFVQAQRHGWGGFGSHLPARPVSIGWDRGPLWQGRWRMVRWHFLGRWHDGQMLDHFHPDSSHGACVGSNFRLRQG